MVSTGLAIDCEESKQHKSVLVDHFSSMLKYSGFYFIYAFNSSDINSPFSSILGFEQKILNQLHFSFSKQFNQQ